MYKFELVNPKILGTFETIVSDDNEEQAANTFWKNITNHVSGIVPSFHFTILNKDNNELSSWKVSETLLDNSKLSDYTIEKVDLNLNKKDTKNLLERVKKVEKLDQSGGKKKKRYSKHNNDNDDGDDSSSSSDDDDDSVYKKFALFSEKNKPKPIIYWWYTPTIYKIDSFYVPTFYAPLSPYVEISVNSMSSSIFA